MPGLTVCLGFRDWYVDHLAHCLRSLRALTTVRNAELEIIVVDTGSQPLVAAQVERLCHEVGNVLLVRAPRQGEWSRSFALNLASRYAHAKAQWYVFTDADMVFPEDWLYQTARFLQTTVAKLALTRSRDLLPQIPPDPAYHRDDLLAASIIHPEVGQGGAMVVRKDWFREVRGFDETYKVWGCEDNDLVMRAFWSGSATPWIPNTFVAHQWHRRDWPTPEQMTYVHKNREHLFAMQRLAESRVVRNPDGWAGALEEIVRGT